MEHEPKNTVLPLHDEAWHENQKSLEASISRHPAGKHQILRHLSIVCLEKIEQQHAELDEQKPDGQ